MRCSGLAFGWGFGLVLMAIAAGCGSNAAVAGGTGGASGGGTGGAGGNAGAGGDAAGPAGGNNGNGSGGAAGAEQGIVATIGTNVTEFRREPFAYAGRPPLLEISAGSPADGGFRISVAPDNGTTITAGQTYVCRKGFTFMSHTRTAKQYDTYTKAGGSCTVTVTEAGSSAGSRFAGTFSGKLIGTDTGEIQVSNGSFLGVLRQ